MNKFALSMDLEAQDVQEKGSFQGIAYSGAPAKKFGYDGLVFDLSSLSFNEEQIPVLLDHDMSQRAGFATLSIEEDQLKIKGKLLESSPHGRQIKNEAKEGFNWKLSIGVMSTQFREIKKGEMEVVNGREVMGPATVFSNSEVYETSFVAVPADSNASVNILKKQGDPRMEITKEQVLSFELDCGCGGDKKASKKMKVSELLSELDATQRQNQELSAEKEELAAKIQELSSRVEELALELAKYKKKEKLSAIEFAYEAAGLELSKETAEELSESENLEIFLSSLKPSGKVIPGKRKELSAELTEEPKSQAIESQEDVQNLVQKFKSEGLSLSAALVKAEEILRG